MNEILNDKNKRYNN